MDVISSISSWLSNNWFFVAIIVGIFFFGYLILKKFWKEKNIIIKRSDVLREDLIRSMKYNKSSDFKTLYKGMDFLGKIISFKSVFINPKENKKNPDKIKDWEELQKLEFDFKLKWNEFKKTKDKNILIELQELDHQIIEARKKAITFIIFNPKLFWKFHNPFKKEPIEILDKLLIKDFQKKNLIIPADVYLQDSMGRYFDHIEPQAHINIIKEDMLSQDFDLMSSKYYVHSLEESTYRPSYAHDVVLKEEEIKKEQAHKQVIGEKM